MRRSQPISGSDPVTVAHVTTVDNVLYFLLLVQLRSFRDAGYDVVGISSPGKYVDPFTAEGFRHIPLPIAREISLWRDLASLWRLYRLFKREKFTIVHTHNPKPGLIGQIAARLAGVPIIVNTIHGYPFHERMQPVKRRMFIAIEKIASLCSDSILSQNQEDLRTAVAEKICAPDKIKHLGNGIDLIKFDPNALAPDDIRHKRAELGLADETPVVGFVGRLAAKRKGFLDFLIAAQQIAEKLPNARFLIVGTPDKGKSDSVEPSVAHAYGVADRCLFLGMQPNDVMPLLYRMMNVLVLPSLFEGMPRAIMEASAMQVPVVASDVKGNRETVDHEQNGLLVPLGDTTALTRAILQILSDKEQARKMGKAGRAIALERFDEHLISERIKSEYARLLRDKISSWENSSANSVTLNAKG